MATNPFIKQYDWRGTQSLMQDLTIEAIQFYGVDVYYLPRTVVNDNDLHGEDTLSIFYDALPIEMYPKNVTNWDGEGELLGKFGVEIRNSMTFGVAKKRFDQIIRGEVLYDDLGRPIEPAEADKFDPLEESALSPNESARQGTYSAWQQPREGDVLYFPMVDKLFEIKHVVQEDLFYQFGLLTTYELVCDLFEYSSERFFTNVAAIQLIANNYTYDVFHNEILDSANNVLRDSSNNVLIDEEFRIDTKDAFANNQLFRIHSNDVVNWSEDNPFDDSDQRYR